MDPYRKADSHDTTPDAPTTCPRCGCLLVAETPSMIGMALLEHTKTCGVPTVHCINADAETGPYMIEMLSRDRAVRASVDFTCDGHEARAKVSVYGEPTPEECAAMVAWCRSRWHAPTRVQAIAFEFRV